MNNLRAILLGVVLAFFGVLPIVSKTYDSFIFSDQRQNDSLQEKNSINDYSAKDLSAHYVLKMCNIIGLSSGVFFIILTVFVRFKKIHQVRNISNCSIIKDKMCHEEEPFLLRAATVWILGILITVAIFVIIIYISIFS